MPHATQLAVTLDEEMFMRNGVYVFPPDTDVDDLPEVVDLKDQMRGRLLLKYLRSGTHRRYSINSKIKHFRGQHWLTPTPLCTAAVVKTLALPTDLDTPSYALLLDPERIVAYGPRRIRGGSGAIEYLIKHGFDVDAIVDPPWPREIK